jgi:hypothetical protein
MDSELSVADTLVVSYLFDIPALFWACSKELHLTTGFKAHLILVVSKKLRPCVPNRVSGEFNVTLAIRCVVCWLSVTRDHRYVSRHMLVYDGKLERTLYEGSY